MDGYHTLTVIRPKVPISHAQQGARIHNDRPSEVVAAIDAR